MRTNPSGRFKSNLRAEYPYGVSGHGHGKCECFPHFSAPNPVSYFQPMLVSGLPSNGYSEMMLHSLRYGTYAVLCHVHETVMPFCTVTPCYV